MAEKIEDLNLPTSVIAKLMKEKLPPGVSTTREVKCAIARAASVFILYLTSDANTKARQHKRKTILPSDIMESLSSIGFDDYLPSLKEAYKEYQESQSKEKCEQLVDIDSSTIANDVEDTHEADNHDKDSDMAGEGDDTLEEDDEPTEATEVQDTLNDTLASFIEEDEVDDDDGDTREEDGVEVEYVYGDVAGFSDEDEPVGIRN